MKQDKSSPNQEWRTAKPKSCICESRAAQFLHMETSTLPFNRTFARQRQPHNGGQHEQARHATHTPGVKQGMPDLQTPLVALPLLFSPHILLHTGRPVSY